MIISISHVAVSDASSGSQPPCGGQITARLLCSVAHVPRLIASLASDKFAGVSKTASTSKRVFEASLEFTNRFDADADSEEPAGDAALFDEIQFGKMCEDCVGTAECKICSQIWPFTDFEMIEYGGRCHGRVLEHDG